jgi:hypothetical protein
MRRNKILFILIIFSWWLSSCTEDNGFVGFTGDEFYRLLSNDSTKIWKKRIEKINGNTLDSDECHDLTLLEFGEVDNISQIRYFEIKLDPESCEGDSSILRSGTWMLSINSEDPMPTDTIQFITGPDTTMKWIIEISAMNLTLESVQDGDELTESYTSVEGLY